MSAAANLMGLVTQLQNMECAISSIIMESAMKLASLTSASVFIAIETEDARRFTGSPHMMQTYLQRNLVPSGRDLQIDVDLSARIIHEHPPQFQPQPMYPTSSNGGGIPGPSTSASPQQRPSKPFMKRSAPGTASSVGDAPATPPKRQKSVDSSLVIPKVEDQKPELLADGTPADPSSSNAIALASGNNDLGTDFDVDDDDSDIEVLESVSFMDGDKMGEESFANTPATSSGMAPVNHPDRRMDAQPFVPVDVSQNQMKIDALRAIENPLLAFQKGSVANRLLASCCYEWGANLCALCPYPLDLKHHPTKTFFNKNFDHFMKSFPQFMDVHGSPLRGLQISHGSATLTPAAYMRLRARTGFTSRCKPRNLERK